MRGIESRAVGMATRGPLALLLAVALALSGCATAGLGDNVGVRVESDSSQLFLSWDPAHPWADSFQTRPAAYHLYAQYRWQSRPYEQDLGPARSAGVHSMSFVLPAALKAVPDAQVCLFISASRAGASVPVRAHAVARGDTAMFRYPAWEELVRAGGRASTLQQDAVRLEANVRDHEQALSRMREALERTGVHGPEDCATPAGVASSSGNIPPEVFAPGQQADATRRLCVRRTRNLYGRLDQDLSPWVNRAANPQESGLAIPDRTRKLALEMQADWSRWHDRTGPEYIPEIGAESEMLPISSTFVDLLHAFRDGKDDRVESLRQMSVELIEMYHGCTEDVAKQFAIKYEAWQHAAAAKPLRDERYAEYKREACLKQTGDLAALGANLEAERASLRAKREELERTQSRAAALPGGRSLRNDLPCTDL